MFITLKRGRDALKKKDKEKDKGKENKKGKKKEKDLPPTTKDGISPESMPSKLKYVDNAQRD